MNKINGMLLIIIFLNLIHSCGSDIEIKNIDYNRKVVFNNKKFKIECQIMNFLVYKRENSIYPEHSVVSKIKVQNLTNSPLKFDFSNLLLYINNKKFSDKSFIDRVSGGIEYDTTLSPNQIYRENIEWFLVNSEIIPDSVQTIKIVYKDD